MLRTPSTSTLALLAMIVTGCSSNDASPSVDTGATGGNDAVSGVGTGGNAGTGGVAATGTSGSGGAIGSSVSTGSGGSGIGGGTGSGGSSVGGSTGSGGSAGTGGSAGMRSDGGIKVTCLADPSTAQPSGAPPALTAGTWKAITPPGICAGAHFGCMDIRISPCNPYVLYLTTDSEGMWRSRDGGATWTSIGNMPAPISPGDLQINPQNPLEMYVVGGVRGASLGFWVSKDGGDTWAEPAGFTAHADNSIGGWCNDVYDVKADPNDWKHVLLTFHGPWEWTQPPGVLETKDGGDTWIRHSAANGTWGTGHSVFFLGDSATWLVGTQAAGFWRTKDSGVTFTQVSTILMQHGGTASFVSATGVLYVGALSNVLRSTDNGLSFTKVAPSTSDGYYAVIGDGSKLYTVLGNTGSASTGSHVYVTSPESDGVTWTDYNSQKFSDGPYRMAFDPVNRIIYSSNWNAGVWALKVTP